MSQATIAPVVRSVTVGCEQERAFRVFTDEIGRWWPMREKSLSGDAIDVTLEPVHGGRVFETAGDGSAREWGTILAWDPPRRFVMSWLVTANPTEVEVRFTAEGGSTVVEVEHRGWERYGDGAAEKRASYAGGWITVLERFAASI